MISIIALFCEDVRQEASGQYTLIGILPDHIEAPALPAMLPKLGVYIRAEFDSQSRPGSMRVSFVNGDGDEVMPLPNWSAETIDQAYNDARAKGSPIYGLIITAVTAPFRLMKEEVLKVVAEIDGISHIAGILNITASPTASPPPS